MNEAIVDELLGYVQESKASMTRMKASVAPSMELLERRASRLTGLRGRVQRRVHPIRMTVDTGCLQREERHRSGWHCSPRGAGRR